jgi:signal peptidase II
MTESRGLRGPYLWIMGVIVVLDQATKRIVDEMMSLHESHGLIDGFLRLTYVRNRGAAFGILSDADLPFQAVVFSVLSLAALAAIGLYAWRLPAESRLPKSALALIIGGALGNLIDRMRLGYVIDFVDAHVGTYHWPAFNVADSAITVGVVLLVLDMLWRPQASPGERAARGRAEGAAGVPAASPGGE